MSDIDDLLMEFTAPKGPEGVSRYIPDPAEFGSSYRQASQQGWENLSQAGSDIWNQGVNPWNVGRAALAGLEYMASPFTAFGRYLGSPVERGVTDLTGSPTAGKVVGETVALAPTLAVPFPGASAIRAAPEAAGLIAGEYPAARMATEGVINKLGARGASTIPQATDDLEGLVDEVAGGTRQTSRAKTLEEEVALRWFNDQFKGGGPTPAVPPLGDNVPSNVRLLRNARPKVGDKKYSGDVLEGYDPGEGRPTFRTSHSPTMPQEQSPLAFYENAFRREFEPSNVALGSPPSQMPLLPGRNPALEDMYLPNVRAEAQVDPRVLAELKLKFGGGSPQGGTEPPFMPQQTAGVRPPAQMPIPGAQPMQPQNTNVLLPSEMMPVPMGVEARQNVNRLRTDLGLPEDPTEATRQAREPLASRPPVPESPVSPAQAPKAVTQYGEIEAGQPYDIVMNTGGQEMRAPGGIVKELIYKNEPVVEKGKSVVRPVGYAILEDGRQVPTKLLQRTGTIAQPSAQMSGPKPPVGRKLGAPDIAPQEVDPAFAELQKSMGKKTGSEPPVAPTTEPVGPTAVDVAAPPAKTYDAKNVSSVGTAIKDIIRETKGKVAFSQIKERVPGVSNSMINKAYDELIKGRDVNLVRQTDPATKENFIVRRKMTDAERKAKDKGTSVSMRDTNFTKGLQKIREGIKGDVTYLHNFSGYNMAKAGHEIKDSEIAKRLNAMIEKGEVKVYTENSNKPINHLTQSMFDPEELDEDILIEFVKKAKKAKGDI